MDAVVSGRAGVALLLDRERLRSIQVGRLGEAVQRCDEDIRWLLGDAKDLEFLENVEPDDVAQYLDLASAKADALHLALILLDPQLTSDTRQDAAKELTELLEIKGILEYVEGVLYSHPLPGEADLAGALLCCTAGTELARQFLLLLGERQEEIARIHLAWIQVPTRVFGSDEDRAIALAAAVEEGLFRDLVMQLVNQASAEVLFAVGVTNVSWRKVQRHRAILLEWVSGWHDVAPESPTEYEIRELILHPGAARGSSTARIGRHLLAGCRICHERVRAALAPPELNYDEAFAGASRALSDFCAKEKPPDHPAEALLQELAQLSEAKQLRRMDSDRDRFATPELVRRLIEDSHSNRYTDGGRALHLAHLAQLAASSCSIEEAGSETRLSDLRSRAWGNFGNSLRINGRFSEADDALTAARSYLEAGTGDPLLHAGLLGQIASLRTLQGRYPEALELSEEEAEIYREIGYTHNYASALVQKAIACQYAGEAEEAIVLLNEAIPLIGPEQNPHLLLAACHNLVLSYVAIDQPEQALSLYFEIRSLYKDFEDNLILLRVGWQEGQLLRDLGHLQPAEAALLEARSGFMERNLAHEVALVSLDLAWIYVKLGRTDVLKQTVTEMIPIFSALRVGREALSALLQLQHSAEQEIQALEIIRSLHSRISRDSIK